MSPLLLTSPLDKRNVEEKETAGKLYQYLARGR